MEHYLLTWQLKIRAKWAVLGDSNTKYFHALASGCRNQNVIWALEDEEGHSVEEEASLKELGLRHFSHIFKDDKQTCIFSQLKVIMLYPSMFSIEDDCGFIESVSVLEIEGALRSLKNDKSPGPDRWPVEFFLHFFELVGRDLLKVVESSRISGRITPSLNSTFLALIPKKDKPTTFVDFRPISLCNLVYKLISKIIVVILKLHLDSHNSQKQFWFSKIIKLSSPLVLLKRFFILSEQKILVLSYLSWT